MVMLTEVQCNRARIGTCPCVILAQKAATIKRRQCGYKARARVFRQAVILATGYAVKVVWFLLASLHLR